MMSSNGTLQVNKLPSKRTTSCEIEELYGYSKPEKNAQHVRNGEWAQVAYVASVDVNSSDKAELIPVSTQGSTTIDQKVKFTTAANAMEKETARKNKDRSTYEVEDGDFYILSPRQTASKAQDVVTNILSKGYMLGKGAIRKAKSFDETRRFRTANGPPSPTKISKEKLLERWNSSTSTMNEQVLALSDRTMSAFATAQNGMKGAMSKLVPSEFSNHKKPHERLSKVTAFNFADDF